MCIENTYTLNCLYMYIFCVIIQLTGENYANKSRQEENLSHSRCK